MKFACDSGEDVVTGTEVDSVEAKIKQYLYILIIH